MAVAYSNVDYNTDIWRTWWKLQNNQLLSSSL